MDRVQAYLTFWSILMSILFLPHSAYCVDYEANIRKKKADMKVVLLESADKLFSYEKELIKSIDDVRYEGLETELAPITGMMQDVIHLLGWALQIDPNDFKANYLLGKIYYSKMDLGEGFVDKKMYQLAKKHLKVSVEQKTKALDQTLKQEQIIAKKLYDELIKIHKDAIVEE